MEKLRELLFLKQLKGFGTVKINRHLNTLELADSYEELVRYMQMSDSTISRNELDTAWSIASEKFERYISSQEYGICTVLDDSYPGKLRDLKDKKPPILFYKGDFDLLSKSAISVVGTRNPSDWSQKITPGLIKNLSEKFVIVSGLALGCDHLAHENTVNCSRPTIAVLPSGINVVTPASQKPLYRRIIEQNGCIISTYEPNDSAQKHTYVERDTIIAAISDTTFVIECSVKSGTMHTVNAAHRLGRRLACYIPDDRKSAQYEGNVYMNQELGAVRVSNMNDLRDFYELVGK